MASNSIALHSYPSGQTAGNFTLTISASVSGRNVSAVATLTSDQYSAFSQYSNCSLAVNCSVGSNSKSVSSLGTSSSTSIDCSGTGNYSTSYTCTATWNGVSSGYAPVSGSVSVTVTTGGSPVPTYSLSVSTTPGGTASGSASGLTAGSVRTIIATPNEGYDFDKWTPTAGNVPLDVNSATTTITITQNTSVIANFVETGNARCFINGSWVKMKPYIYRNGSWTKVKPYIYINNEWKKCK